MNKQETLMSPDVSQFKTSILSETVSVRFIKSELPSIWVKKEKKAQNQCITVIVYYVYRFLKFGAMKFDI